MTKILNFGLKIKGGGRVANAKSSSPASPQNLKRALGGGGVSESMDRQGCVTLVFEVVPKNLIFASKFYPKIYFTRFYACYFNKENYASLIYEVKIASSLCQVTKIN